jgi:UPF0755 protein
VLRKIILTFLYVAIPLIVIALSYRGLEYYVLEPANRDDATPVVIELLPEKSFREFARELQDKGLVRTELSLRVIARLNDYDKNLKAGEYELSRSMTPEEILQKIVRGDMVLRRFTVKEGLRVSDIGPLVEAAGISPRAEFDAALADAAFQQELGVPGPSFEGYLFPETYQFPRNTPAKKVIAAMKGQFDAKWRPEWDERVQLFGRSKHEIVTLASIVEKESGNVDEQPKIASVFHNRLRIGMRLQADPTVIYGIQNFNGNITKEDLQMPTPYNTYVIPGLPPGPIANPGLSALTATLFPEQTNYLYFVGNGKGRHIFSENLYDHNNAVNEFQRGGAPSEPQPPAVAP